MCGGQDSDQSEVEFIVYVVSIYISLWYVYGNNCQKGQRSTWLGHHNILFSKLLFNKFILKQKEIDHMFFCAARLSMCVKNPYFIFHSCPAATLMIVVLYSSVTLILIFRLLLLDNAIKHLTAYDVWRWKPTVLEQWF